MDSPKITPDQLRAWASGDMVLTEAIANVVFKEPITEYVPVENAIVYESDWTDER